MRDNKTTCLYIAAVSLIILWLFSINSHTPLDEAPEQTLENISFAGLQYPAFGFIEYNTIRTEFNGSLEVQNESRVLIKSVFFEGSPVTLINCSKVRVETSIFKNVDTAIHLINCEDVYIHKFAIENVSIGIIIENCTYVYLGGPRLFDENDEPIYDSFIKDWGKAPLFVWGSDNVIVQGIDATKESV